MDKTKITIGSLILALLASGVIYITLDEQGVKMRIDDDKSTFYVKESRWVVAGREYNRMFSGTKQLYRDRKSIQVTHETNDDMVKIQRVTKYKKGPVIVDTWTFEGDVTDVELFPITHNVEVYNGTGYFYRYTVDDLKDTGDKRKLIDETNAEFGRNMKVEWDVGFNWAWIGWPYGGDSLSVQYKIRGDYEMFNVRLFDPPKDTDKIKLKNIPIIEYYNVTIDNPYWTYACYDVSNFTGNTTQCGELICEDGWNCNQTYHHNYTTVTMNRTIGVNQIIEIDDDSFNATANDLYCEKEGQTITCDSKGLDGNGDGICQDGESCLIYEDVKEGKYKAKDHYKKKYENEMRDYNVTEE